MLGAVVSRSGLLNERAWVLGRDAARCTSGRLHVDLLAATVDVVRARRWWEPRHFTACSCPDWERWPLGPDI